MYKSRITLLRLPENRHWFALFTVYAFYPTTFVQLGVYIQTTACVISRWPSVTGGGSAASSCPVEFIIFCLFEATKVLVKIALESYIKETVKLASHDKLSSIRQVVLVKTS